MSVFKDFGPFSQLRGKEEWQNCLSCAESQKIVSVWKTVHDTTVLQVSSASAAAASARSFSSSTCRKNLRGELLVDRDSHSTRLESIPFSLLGIGPISYQPSTTTRDDKSLLTPHSFVLPASFLAAKVSCKLCADALASSWHANWLKHAETNLSSEGGKTVLRWLLLLQKIHSCGKSCSKHIFLLIDISIIWFKYVQVVRESWGHETVSPAACAASSFCFSWFSFSSASTQELQTQHANPIRKASAPANHVICWLSYPALMKRRTLPVGQGILLSIIEKCLASFFIEIVKRSLSAWQNSVTFRESATTVPVPCTSLLRASASLTSVVRVAAPLICEVPFKGR